MCGNFELKYSVLTDPERNLERCVFVAKHDTLHIAMQI